MVCVSELLVSIAFALAWKFLCALISAISSDVSRDVKQADKWNEKVKKYVKVQDARRPEIITVFSNGLEARESGEGVSRVFCSLCGKFVGGQNFSKWAVADHIFSDAHQAKLNASTKDEEDDAVVKDIFDEASAGECVDVGVEEKVRLFRVKVVKIFLGKGKTPKN